MFICPCGAKDNFPYSSRPLCGLPAAQSACSSASPSSVYSSSSSNSQAFSGFWNRDKIGVWNDQTRPGAPPGFGSADTGHRVIRDTGPVHGLSDIKVGIRRRGGLGMVGTRDDLSHVSDLVG